jgi:hypothetical protein
MSATANRQPPPRAAQNGARGRDPAVMPLAPALGAAVIREAGALARRLEHELRPRAAPEGDVAAVAVQASQSLAALYGAALLYHLVALASDPAFAAGGTGTNGPASTLRGLRARWQRSGAARGAGETATGGTIGETVAAAERLVDRALHMHLSGGAEAPCSPIHVRG